MIMFKNKLSNILKKDSNNKLILRMIKSKYIKHDVSYDLSVFIIPIAQFIGICYVVYISEYV